MHRNSKILVLFVILISFLTCIVLYLIANLVLPKYYFRQTANQSLKLYADWLIKNQTDAGDFVYELDVQTGQRIPGNNIVRQAGSLYSLGHAYAHTKNSSYRAGIERGIHYFQQLFESVDNFSPTVRIAHQGSRKSNAVALFLLAIIEYVEADPETNQHLIPTAHQLARYLLMTQTDEGSFLQTMDPEEESDYNNGESFYALIRMYRLTSHTPYLKSAEKAATYIENTYSQKRFNTSLFAWAMEGFAYLYQIDKNPIYWNFMKTYTDRYLNSQGKNITNYLHDKSQKPPAGNLGVYLEGVAHTAWVAKEVDPLYHRQLVTYMEESLRYLMTLQLNGPYSNRKTTFNQLSGGICYDHSCKTQRIDITHHNLSALYLYLHRAL